MDKKKALEEKIRFQVECEKTAHLTVQRLLDNPVTEDFLIDSGRLIKPEHYDDVIEERAISHQCGYPVCPNSLANNFCSNECYNASNYYKSQLSTSPLWMRKNQKIPTLMLLSKPEARYV
ncbi:hypothetical protein FSP39_018268 [Pinctada imbricata]|uniref:RNA polymerase II subunit B1 CTD phosphatase RPAP2 homolog n=1 Tax=Pinctada imbricata TaxID=66713 RepID=A0AA88XTF0_PINIB|nr:hypothetical protein FSP39_018268 [Pinctada imbricata]